MSNRFPEVTQENYTWKSTNIGADKLQIHPDDPKYVPGTYYIGVLAYKTGLNTFKVTVELQSAPESTDLEKSWEGEVEECKYFKFPVEDAGESRIEVRVSPGRGILALLCSSSLYYPNEEEHTWSVGLYEKESLESEEFLSDLDSYVDLDPFDKYMKRNFTRRPTLRETDRMLKITPENVENRGEELRFCIDTDEWKYSSQMCYLGVKNLTESPVHFKITRREVLEETLLSPQFMEKFNMFRSVFTNLEGSSISQSERKRLQITGNSEFTYGEIDFIHMAPVIELCEPQPGEVFWDLGCGAGKCLMTAACMFPELAKVKGVELLPALHEACKETLEGLETPIPCAPIEVYQGDILDLDWSDADIVYSSSICFPSEMIDAILEKCKELKKGARFITLKSFPYNEIFETKHNLRVKMTWGKTGVYILEKII